MKRFVVPPNWPDPPRRSWIPPRTWRPDPSWPPPPEGWQFWDDGKGNPVRGPVGRYGGPSRLLLVGGAGAAMAFLAINLWALSAIGLFDGQDAQSQAGPVVDNAASTPSVVSQRPNSTTKAPPRRATTTTSKPRPAPTTTRTTARATRTPDPTRTSRKPRRTEEPKPDRTPTTTRTTRPPSARPPSTRPPSTRPTRPPTDEEIARAYCRQQGWPEAWCDPDNWPTSDPSNR